METFVVRVFVPAAGGETPFAGMVEHVGTGWSARFGSDQELLDAFSTWLARDAVPIQTGVAKVTEVTAPTSGGQG